MADIKLILSVNTGSSSLKISVFRLAKDGDEPVVLLLTSEFTSISSPPAKFSFHSTEAHSSDHSVQDQPLDDVKDHASAFDYFLNYLSKEVSIDKGSIAHVCHRVVHGGDYYEPIVISEKPKHHIEALSDLAPLHSFSALAVINSSLSSLPNSNSIAFFDSSFHTTMPEHISSYAINQSIAKEKGLKKYGFHGLSYSFILRQVARSLRKDPSQVSMIALHLGSGASACAIRDGKSIDTSMGLTPLSGLPGATRSGDIDPSLIFHYTSEASRISHKDAKDVGVTEAEEILNTESGWKALSGTTDFRSLTTSPPLSPGHKLAFDIFVDRILNFVGAYYLKLGGRVDALVFAGGVGEKSDVLRAEIGKYVECLGFKVDKEKNKEVAGQEGVVIEISATRETDDGKRILVCRTDEQLEMARECALEEKFWQ